MRKVAIDAGCSYTKIVSYDHLNGIIQKAVPSVMVEGESMLSLDGETNPVYQCNGQTWSAIEHAPNAYPTRSGSYPYEPINAVMMHHGLAMAGIDNDEIQIATTVPLADYYKGGARGIKAVKERKKSAILSTVTGGHGEQLPQLHSKVIVPEGLAGWIDICFDFNGNMRDDLPDADIGLVDIGGRTTDICIVKGLDVYPDSVATLSKGYLNVFENLNKMINNQYPGTKKYPVHTLDLAMRSGKLEIESGRIENIQEEIKAVLHNFTASITSDINRILMETDRHLSGTCFFGGGVEHIRPAIEKMDKTMIADNPQFSNARGAMKAFRI